MSNETTKILVPSGDDDADHSENTSRQRQAKQHSDYESIGCCDGNGIGSCDGKPQEDDDVGDHAAGSGVGRLQNLALITLTTPGIKFFKSAQSSFQEYLMTDPSLRMTATTYGWLLTLISLPLVPLAGGALLDLGGRRGHLAFCLFLLLALLGIAAYGYGLAAWHSIPAGLVGAALFGAGEGCVMVAARALVGQEFLGGDGAAAQGVLIAANNLAMMASKNLVPWLIEREGGADGSGRSILPGIRACAAVQLLSLGAGAAYLCRNRGAGAGVRARPRGDGERGPARCSPGGFRHLTAFVDLPLTFWIVASGRAIFLVTFKVFNRYSNSFLIEKFGVGAVSAGRASSLGELFALFSPLVGLLAYRSPGGIVAFALGAAVLGAASVGALAFCSAAVVTDLPGGVLAPISGISVAHGVIIPVSMAMIPHTVPPDRLGSAFAVFEVLGSTLMLTEVAFGWLRDRTGGYDVPMQLLFLYALAGTVLLWVSRHHLGRIGIER